MSPATTLILYACPLGPLADDLARYFAAAADRFGPNEAHGYMPHITVTGFFHDEQPEIEAYAAAVDRSAAAVPHSRVRVDALLLRPDFHGLTITSPWLVEVGRRFAVEAPSHTRLDGIRPKQWLHLSLAYGFPAGQHEHLATLARTMIDPRAGSRWELRLYERGSGGRWVAHHTRPCATS